ncbi:MAG: hypothetical protein H6978_10580 [Gammaproteobacteria bacterium]|nr:hypothetical protein [Gammaproteobacteria bacterium]
MVEIRKLCRLGLLPLASAMIYSSAVSAGDAASLPADPHDLSGVWMNDNTLDETLKRSGLKRLDPKSATPAPPAARSTDVLTPAYREKYDALADERARYAEGVQTCHWPGMPAILSYPYPFEILHTPGRITMIYEAESQVRRIYLDRDEHLPFDELDPSYNGDSIGHWEGNTLVIDTIGFNTHATVWGDLPHSEDMRIVERMAYVDEDTVHSEVTITDPQAFKQPITRTLVYSKRPDWRIREYSCMENNRDAPDAQGNRQGGVVEQAAP